MTEENNLSKLSQNEFKESSVRIYKRKAVRRCEEKQKGTTGFDVFRHSIRSTN